MMQDECVKLHPKFPR